jgi:carboxyvinyl-carboxyphosphonate phosphorylmutase
VEEAIKRFKMFEAVGVDALFLPTVNSREELDTIASAVRLPVILGTAHGALADSAYLASRNVRLWSGGHQSFGAAMKALCDAMSELRRGTRNDALTGIAPRTLVDKVLRTAAYEAATREFLGGK